MRSLHCPNKWPFSLSGVNFIGAPLLSFAHKEYYRSLSLHNERSQTTTTYLVHVHVHIPRSESIDTIPSNFSQWLGRGQVIRAAAHIQQAETNHNVSSSVDERHRGEGNRRCDWSVAVFLATR